MIEQLQDHLPDLNNKVDWTAKPADPPPRDYFVPNFGVDKDIQASFESLGTAEANRKHKWVWKDESWKVPPVVPYYNQPRQLDEDIAGT